MTPTKIAEILTVYKEEVHIPMKNLEHVLRSLDKSQWHLLAIGVKGESVIISYAESVKSINHLKPSGV